MFILLEKYVKEEVRVCVCAKGRGFSHHLWSTEFTQDLLSLIGIQIKEDFVLGFQAFKPLKSSMI